MSRQTASAHPGADRASLCDDITNKIIAELEAGRVPWVQPWGAVIEHGFPGQDWLTFHQALGLGGNVRKGERGTTVVDADRFVLDGERRRARETDEEAAAIPLLIRGSADLYRFVPLMSLPSNGGNRLRNPC